MRYIKKKAFVSLAVLLLFNLLLTMIVTYADCLRNYTACLRNLKTIEAELTLKARVLREFKVLLSEDKIGDYNVGAEVKVSKINDEYILNYAEHELTIVVQDGKISEVR